MSAKTSAERLRIAVRGIRSVDVATDSDALILAESTKAIDEVAADLEAANKDSMERVKAKVEAMTQTDAGMKGQVRSDRWEVLKVECLECGKVLDFRGQAIVDLKEHMGPDSSLRLRVLP